MRAYITAGYPGLCPPLASFDDWSRLVRSPLVWLGCADPMRTMETARSEDPGIVNLRAVVAAWLAAVGTDKRLTAGDLREAALSSSISDATGNLNRALLAVAAPPGRSEVDTRRLGNWLGRHRGRIIDGIKIHSEQDKHSKQMVWWLAEILSRENIVMVFIAGTAGTCGYNLYPSRAICQWTLLIIMTNRGKGAGNVPARTRCTRKPFAGRNRRPATGKANTRETCHETPRLALTPLGRGRNEKRNEKRSPRLAAIGLLRITLNIVLQGQNRAADRH